MASLLSVAALTLGVWASLLLLISPAHSLNCTSQTLKNNKKFDKCLDLPTLSSYLHYTYNATNSSLSVAFVAPPAKPEGWIAWAINPTAEGMAGSQALLAFKSNNKVAVKTFNLVSYSNVTESKLSFETWDLSGEATPDGNLVIYGSMKVADKVEKLNQVWQVGAEVTNGNPRKHEFQPENLKAKSTLALEKSGSGSGNVTHAPPPTSSSSPPAQAPVVGGQQLIKSNPLSLFVALLVFTAGVFFS